MVRNVVRIYACAYAGLPREIWMLSAALFINRCGTMVLPFFALYMTSGLGETEATAGRVLSVYGLGSIVGAYLGGRLTPAWGAIRVQIVALLLSVPLFLMVPLWTTVGAIAVSMFFLALCSDAVRPANATATSIFTPPQMRVRAFGLQRMALNLGVSFGPAIGGVLATISFVWLFVADAATTLLCALALVWFFAGRGPQKSDSSGRETRGSQTSASPLRDPMYGIYLALLLLSAVVFMQVNATYPLFLRDHYGLSTPAIGLVFAVNTVVIVLFEMLLLDAIRQWPMVRVIGWGAFFSCVGFGMLPFGNSVAYCVGSMLVITLGEMLWMPLSMGWVSQRSERGDRAMYMSYCTMTYAVASILAPALGGALYQWHRNAVWYLSAAAGVLALAGFHLLDRLLAREECLAAVPESGATAAPPSENPGLAHKVSTGGPP